MSGCISDCVCAALEVCVLVCVSVRCVFCGDVYEGGEREAFCVCTRAYEHVCVSELGVSACCNRDIDCYLSIITYQIS